MVASKSDLALPGNNAGGAITTSGETSPAKPPVKSTLSIDDMAARVAHYPEPIREETLFVQRFFVQHCNSSLTVLQGLAKQRLKFRRESTSYFGNWLQGYYFKGTGAGGRLGEQGKAEWLNFCELLREHDRVTDAIGKMGIVVTSTVRAIDAYVKDVISTPFTDKFGMVCGMTGGQKTHSLRFITRVLGFPKALCMECRARDSLVGFQRKLAKRYNTKVKKSAAGREEELEETLTEDKVVIIPNFQRAIQAGKKGMKQHIVEWLLEIQEEQRFSLVLEIMREEFALELLKKELGGSFEQLIGRIGGAENILMLPEFAPIVDLRAISTAFKLPDSTRTMDDFLVPWSRQPGRIRIVFKRLERALRWVKADARERVLLSDLEEVNQYVPPAQIDDEGGAA